MKVRPPSLIQRLVGAFGDSWVSYFLGLCSLIIPTSLPASNIISGNVTTTLGPTFFIDDASNGGGDVDYVGGASYHSNRNFNGLLTRNQGPTRVTLTGLGFAAHTSATANNATSVNMTFTYLGADEAIGGGDDVVVGSTTGTYQFTTGGEYHFTFPAPLGADLNITGTRFRITINPNGTMKLKTGTVSYESTPLTAAKLSVAGFAAPTINPQRLNLAKFQPVTAASISGQRLASYVTDGVAGNDNRWQGANTSWQWVAVNFPFPVEVGSAHIFTGVDESFPVGSYSVQSWNGSSWVAIPGASVSSNTNTERNLVFSNPVTSSAFRFLASESNLRVREIALFPPNGPSGYPLGTDVMLNLAYQRPTVASGNHTAGNFPLRAVDGRTSGGFWQTTVAGNNTLEIDLRVTSRIGSVHLYSGSPGVAPLGNFTLQSWSGTNWQTIPGGAITENTQADRVVTFTTPVTTSLVRLVFENPGTTSIRELMVFPSNAGNIGYPLGTNVNPSGRYADYEEFNDSFYQVSNPASGRFAAVAPGGSPALDQAGLTTAQGQYQVLLNLSSGTYRLRNRATGNCLSGAQLSENPGEPLIDAPYTAMPHQDWILQPLGGGTYQLINQWSGLAIDTEGGATTQATRLVQNTPSSATTQRWQLTHRASYPKKGIGGTSFANNFKPDWSYNWGPSVSESLAPTNIYFPMQWGNFNWDIGSNRGPIRQHYSDWRDTAGGLHVLGFNEPDRTEQANMTLASVLTLWPRLMELDQPLVSPAPGTAAWLNDFYPEADRLGYRVDATAIHLYPGPTGGSSDNLVSSILTSYTNGGNRPVWLTEFSFVDWGGNSSWSEEDSYTTLAEFLWRAESIPELRKYALFVFTEDDNNPQPPNSWQATTPAPRSNSRDRHGNLTAFGKLYAAWDQDTTVRGNKTYTILHRGLEKRLANAGTTNSTPGGRTIRTDGPIVNWTLVPTGTVNQFYLVSEIDGRRLSHTSGTGVSPTLAAPGTTGANVTWTINATSSEPEKGWYHLRHHASNTRLQLLSFNATTNVAAYRMVASTTTDSSVQWRFIVPVDTADNTSPSLNPIPPQTFSELTPVQFTANATEPDLPAPTLFYSLLNAPAGASINSTTGNFSWTPTEAQGPGNYTFTVRVSDGYLTANQSVSLTVNEVNVPPVLEAISPQTIAKSSQLAFSANATDADLPANTLTYSLLGAPTSATIDASTGLFTWAPSVSQGPAIYDFFVRVSDGQVTQTQPVTVTVIGPVPSASVDTDSDGHSDLLEFATGTNLHTPSPNPLRILTVHPDHTASLSFSWNWRATGVSWRVRHGSNLTDLASWPVVSPGTTSTVREGDLDQITIRPALIEANPGFFTLEVTTP